MHLRSILGLGVACAVLSPLADAHGFAGKRFFPATLATDDPFVSDELSLPTLARRSLGASGGSPGTIETTAAVDYTKRITENLGLSIGATYVRDRSGAETAKGFDNLSAGAKYQLYRSAAGEAILSAGLDWDIGGSGAKAIGEPSGTVTPALLFGKGFGDLPENASWLRPFALTGSAGVAIPTRSARDEGDGNVERLPRVLQLGVAAEYSIPYLQAFVKDLGWRAPWNRLVPVVELALRKPLDRGGGAWTGTVNPGVIWAGHSLQVGLEAVIPANRITGGTTGAIFQLHYFLDDIFPHTLGKPLL